MGLVRDIVRMSQIAPTWMLAVSPGYRPDIYMFVCLAIFVCILLRENQRVFMYVFIYFDFFMF